MKLRTRGLALGVAMTAIALSACSSNGASTSTNSGAAGQNASLTVGFDNPLGYTNNMPVLIAIDQGYFAKNGLDVKTVAFNWLIANEGVVGV